jgi:quinohemoprotein ethanol dehydrogenase
VPFNTDPAVLARGLDLYGQRCAYCHGGGAASGGTIADLRYAAPTTYDNFQNIVREGAFTSFGMPNLGAFLNEEEADAIKQYILSRRALLMQQ